VKDGTIIEDRQGNKVGNYWDGSLKLKALRIKKRLGISSAVWSECKVPYSKDDIMALQSMLIMIEGLMHKMEEQGCMFCND
jgi:hypothetical protein